MELSRRRSALLGRLRRRRTRAREGLFLVEGIRSVDEALRHGAEARFAVCSPRLEALEGGADLLARLEGAGVDVSRVDDAGLAELADTEAPQGVLLVCAEPRWTLGDLEPGASPVLVLDALQDPGNVGTLVRAAAAFGLAGVVALDGTVDPFNPKAVRAAAGGLFRTRVVSAGWSDVERWLATSGRPLLAAAAGGEDVAGAGSAAAGWALAVGNEGRGCRPPVLAAARRVVAVPMEGGVESLNAGVAGAILIYALTRTVPPARSPQEV